MNLLSEQENVRGCGKGCVNLRRKDLYVSKAASKRIFALTLSMMMACSLIAFTGCGNEDVVENQEENVQEQQEQEKTPEQIAAEQAEAERIAALKADKEKGLFVLVNKQNSVDRSYVPDDLEGIKYYAADRTASARFMKSEAAAAFHELAEAAMEEGHKIVITTAYRSYDFQSTLYNNYVANYGQAEADTFSAKPGTSEHQTGLATDVSSPSVNYQLTSDYINTPEGTWLNDNAHKFGFIIRYQKDKESITGYIYEPWHIRYVGKTAAKEIYEQGLALEEYLEQLKELELE